MTTNIALPVRPRTLRRWLAAAGVGAVLAGAGIGWAADAHADPIDELVFITVLDQQGIIYTSEAAVVEAGYGVCDLRDTGVSELGVAMFVQNNSNLTAFDAGYFVGAAEAAFCPWHSDAGGRQLA